MKKKLTLVLMGLCMTPVWAQKFGGFDADDLGAAMSKAGDVTACMQKLDQEALKVVQAEAEAVQKEVRAFCTEGKREEAQATAIAFGKELVDKPVVKEMQACTGLAGETIPQMAWSQLESSDKVREHVCDTPI